MVSPDKVALEIAQMTYYSSVKGGKWDELAKAEQKQYLSIGQLTVDLLDKQNYVVITKKEYEKTGKYDDTVRLKIQGAIDKWVKGLKHPKNIHDWVTTKDILEAVWQAINS